LRELISSQGYGATDFRPLIWFTLQLPRRIKMAWAIFFICMFLLAGLIIVMDDGQWDRKNK
jgi:hypothetical protein